MKKELQRKRNMRLFIDATIDLIKEEGINSVSIRKVGERALFNSATIYNYFKNVDHLKSIAAVGLIDGYINSLNDCVLKSKNSFELLTNVWESFYSNVYNDPETFHTLFARKKGKYTVSNMQQYYELYPEQLINTPDSLSEMLLSGDLKSRNMYLLEKCANEGYFNSDDLEDIDNHAQYVFQGLLNDLLHGNINSYEEFLDKALKYNEVIFSHYKLK